jgi:glycosyltransferase involved in cell wall biosynthesis
MKNKILFVLHLPPPNHGAAKVGEIIKNSKIINESFECKFIPIISSKSIGDIGKINLEKFSFARELRKKIEKELDEFKPDKIYYTPSTGLVGFLRDYYVTVPIRKYKKKNKEVKIYYHYHTKGLYRLKKVDFLLREFLKNSNVILLSKLLKGEFLDYPIKNFYFLPNGIESGANSEKKNINNSFLYINHLIEMKGYKETLKLAKAFPEYNFDFAGNFGSEDDKKYFFEFIEKYKLKNIKYHGYVSGVNKINLYKKNDALIYLSKNDAFPLTLLEALSYGLPVFTTKVGAIPEIINNEVGFINESFNEELLIKNFKLFMENYLNPQTFKKCRERYLNYYTIEKFEYNLKRILND